MSTPARPHRGPAASTAPRTGMELSDWAFVAWTLATAALLLRLTDQAAHLGPTREGPLCSCATQRVPDSARALGAGDLGVVPGEETFFPPTFVCCYPHQDRVQPSMTVDIHPAGPWIFLELCGRARPGHGPRHDPPAAGAVAGYLDRPHGLSRHSGCCEPLRLRTSTGAPRPKSHPSALTGPCAVHVQLPCRKWRIDGESATGNGDRRVQLPHVSAVSPCPQSDSN